MGGRGGSESGGGMPGPQFSAIVVEQADAVGFELNELQKLILSMADDRDIITDKRSREIIDDGDIMIPGVQEILDEADDDRFIDPHDKPKKIRSRSILLRDALNFWKMHHSGLLPDYVQAFFNIPYNKDTYLRGSQNYSNVQWVEMTSQLDGFGQWLNLVLVNEIVGLPMPTNFSDYA